MVGEGVTCTVGTRSGPTRAGLHPSTGGDGSDACSGDILGVDREVPVGHTDVTITFAFSTDADEVKVSRLVELAERYCVVAQTLRQPPSMTMRCEVSR